jgi:dihydroflavonol-4-reductase
MPKQKRVLIVGGTGFLGFHAASEFLKKGWKVTALGLPPAPPAHLFPEIVKIVLQDMEKTSSEELTELLRGYDALVFAAGMDDRVTPKKPAYPKLHHANVEVCQYVLESAQKAGVKRAVVLGSYYAHFDRLWPELRLAERHPYIRSRVEQEQAALGVNGITVSVLELPYIFGDSLGRRPLWYPLVKYIRATPLIFYMKGGSACITATTVGQAIVGAIESTRPGQYYPIGDENLTWVELLKRLAAADGRKRKVIALPTWIVRVVLNGLWLLHRINGREAGLDPRYFASIQTANTFIDPLPSKEALGYETGGLDEALKLTIAACRN